MRIYKSFVEVDDSWKDGIRHGIDALKHGWNGVARDCAQRAEKDFLSIKGFYDGNIAEIHHSYINALKGLAYYSLKNPSQDAEYAHTLILRKQLMRRIKKELQKPLESAIQNMNYVNFMSHNVKNSRPTFLYSMKEYNKTASQLKNEKYDDAISEIDERLKDCGVGKF